MNTVLDFTNADKVIERAKEDPTSAIRNATWNDFRLIVQAASQDVYSELMEKLKGQEELKDLLFAFNHLEFVHYPFDDAVVSDIDEAKKIICDIWPRLASH
jgi:hypothetical protein